MCVGPWRSWMAGGGCAALIASGRLCLASSVTSLSLCYSSDDLPVVRSLCGSQRNDARNEMMFCFSICNFRFSICVDFETVMSR